MKSAKFFDTRIRHFRAAEVQPLKLLESGQFFHARICHFREAEYQRLELSK